MCSVGPGIFPNSASSSHHQAFKNSHHQYIARGLTEFTVSSEEATSGGGKEYYEGSRYRYKCKGSNAGSVVWEIGKWVQSPRPQAVRSKRSASGHPTARSIEHLCQRSTGEEGGLKAKNLLFYG
ncbi:hypothetical protein P691DRAFT_804005 [Macrolepiota fuliginosa MF-IS2]|uniref:Uncharacterized protein n=1 Tax=Macrolepiota fuliginosa MF-IS2 TaxID=1400762 RepID=A0A9P6C0A0_9AGAR|nr:hypothetical protein P691DRAFT_804005 [Macrolepiota fuliginosa MF-IS2]